MTGRILVVDDVATNRIVMKVKLAAACYAVEQADCGHAALAAARSNHLMEHTNHRRIEQVDRRMVEREQGPRICSVSMSRSLVPDGSLIVSPSRGRPLSAAQLNACNRPDAVAAWLIWRHWAVEGSTKKVSGIPDRTLRHIGNVPGDVCFDIGKPA